MPRADIDGVGIHYEVDGTGFPLLVLHGGLGVDHVPYRRTLAPLAGSFTLVLPDHRGNGRSVPADLAGVTIERLADDAAELMGHLGHERFVVLGHSYGGFVAQELALRHPDRVAALVLVDTTPGQLGSAESSDAQEQGPPMPPEAAARMATMPASDADLEAAMAGLLPYYFHHRDLAEVASLFDGTIHRADVMARGFEVLAAWSSVDRLHEIDVPALVVAGRHDVFTSFPQAYRIAGRLPDAEVAIFEHSGHFPWIEEPDAFFATLREWAARKLAVR